MKKRYVAKILLVIRLIFLHESNLNYNSYSYKLAFIIFMFFLRNQKQESSFQQVAGAQPEIFKGKGGFVELERFNKSFFKNARKKDPIGKNIGAFSPRSS